VAPRIVEAILGGRQGAQPTGAMRAVLGGQAEIPGRPCVIPPLALPSGETDAAKQRDGLQRSMTAGAGVLRSEASLRETASVVSAIAAEGTDDPELRNLVTLGWALLHPADARRG